MEVNMGRQNDELERIKRIRDQQLAARDPTHATGSLQAKVRARRQIKKLTFKNLLSDFTAKWTWMVQVGLSGLSWRLWSTWCLKPRGQNTWAMDSFCSGL